MTEAQERLMKAAHAVQTAGALITMEQATIEAFLQECRNMDNFGSIVDPTLFNNSERRATEAVVKPLFEAAITFLHAYNHHLTKAREALAKVKA